MEKLIDKYLPADYHDTFVIKASKPAEQIVPKELIKKIFTHSPAWLSFLYKVRNILVKPFGIEGGDILKSEDEDYLKDYIIEDTENEAIMRKDDKHLLFYVSIAKIENNLIDVTTVVQYHNALGKVYFFFIKPFHKMIVPRVVKDII
ncbi:DUF2867 domain-containing protein [Bacteroides oleiciplenus]|uniref:DUF2867 domain-containing protein n=2 Tax=Bacteroides oleiciplenus TaxID=626931 RepID=K9EG76_9BACE|nr:DUF2867 domain-containing protein [Bacteroides oleiciplenus]EKU89882.1 hypothetical protein HMPREF9447_03320 [Bacteroides oleiciplenus YIT 12058]RGN40426.1 DUF2867 domain-containing protein [Bacteroides oleiciplenus]